MTTARDSDNISKNKSILIVDDEYDIVKVIKQALHGQGFGVCAFTNPAIALEHFKVDYQEHDFILSDIRMRGMSGYEFVKKAKGINTQVKTILMSSFRIEDTEFDDALPDIKVDAFLQKPFSIQDLSNVIQKIDHKSGLILNNS
jgi:DNA-binding NtrC family response regulator